MSDEARAIDTAMILARRVIRDCLRSSIGKELTRARSELLKLDVIEGLEGLFSDGQLEILSTEDGPNGDIIVKARIKPAFIDYKMMELVSDECPHKAPAGN